MFYFYTHTNPHKTHKKKGPLQTHRSTKKKRPHPDQQMPKTRTGATAKRPRTEPPVNDQNDIQRKRIRHMLEAMRENIDDFPPSRMRDTAMNMFSVNTPPHLEQSQTVVLFFGYQNPGLLDHPVFLSLADARRLTDDELCELLHNAALASCALALVAKMFEAAGLIAKLGETARADTSFLRAPNPETVILHITPDGLNVGYSPAPQLRVLIDKRIDDANALAALIVQAAPHSARTPR